MWLNFVAGALHFPTTSRPQDSIEIRIALLRRAVADLMLYRNARMAAAPGPKWNNHTGRPSMILVAPEYMFLNEGYAHPQNQQQLTQNRFLEATDHRRIVETLKAISAQYGKQLVFVPGTIASRTPIPRGTHGALEAIVSAGEKVTTGASYIQGQLHGSSPAQRLLYGEAGALMGHASRSPGMKLMGLNSMLAKNRKGQPCYIASNVAYMFNDGRLVGTYNKRADYHEVLPLAKDDTVFVPGIKPGRATVGGINFGIEICLDHACGVLKNAPTITGVRPRIHMICSAHVNTEPSRVLVQEGGYIMHASSDIQATGVYRQLKGYRDPENLQFSFNGGGRLTMGTIELEHHGL